VKRLLFVFLVILGIILLAFVWVFAQIFLTRCIDNAEKADAIAVLGAAEYAGRPSPVFEARLNHAFDLYKKEMAPFIITTGGKFPGEKLSEGEVGAKYLAAKNIPSEKILIDKDSLTTKQSIARIKEIAEAKNLKKIILVSDPFHMYRAKVIAEDLGMEVTLSPTRESPIKENTLLEFKYMAREMTLVILHMLFDV